MDREATHNRLLDLALAEALSLEREADRNTRIAVAVAGFSATVAAAGDALLSGDVGLVNPELFETPLAILIVLWGLALLVVCGTVWIALFREWGVRLDLPQAKEILDRYPLASVFGILVNIANEQNVESRKKLRQHSLCLTVMLGLIFAQILVLSISPFL